MDATAVALPGIAATALVGIVGPSIAAVVTLLTMRHDQRVARKDGL